MSSPETLTRLDARTKSHHASADRPWLQLMTADVRRHDYVRQLVIAYGFEAPLEAALAYTIDLTDLVSLRERTRAGKLAQDLLALGISPARLTQLPQCISITPFRDPAEALGWMYVVERATLLHDSVRRSVIARVPEAKHATTYLDACGAAHRRLHGFAKTLGSYAQSQDRFERVAVAAERAFTQWLTWNEQSQLEVRSAG